MEIWKKIEGFKYYEISNIGRVRSLERTFIRTNPRWKKGSQKITVGGKIVSGWVREKNGKPTCVFVSIREGYKTYTFRVHRLVLQAFIGPSPNGYEGCHNDGNPLNNRLENLRWDTHTANMKDAIAHGTKTSPPIHAGDNHPNAKLTQTEIAIIKSQKYYHGLFESLSKEYGISTVHASRIWKGKGRIYDD